MNSAVYEGFVAHQRHTPVEHGFRYDHAMLLLDLDELPELFDCHPLWSARAAALARFARADYLGDPGHAARRGGPRPRRSSAIGERPDGPIRLLTNVRMLGHCFNPVSFYYCFAPAARSSRRRRAGHEHAVGRAPRLRDERRLRRRAGCVLGQSFDKVFHVSPFMGMDHRYDWRLTAPGEQLVAHISSHRNDQLVFDATLSLRRHALDRAALTRLLVRYPATTLRVSARIYGQAVRLKLKGAPYHAHPDREKAVAR